MSERTRQGSRSDTAAQSPVSAGSMYMAMTIASRETYRMQGNVVQHVNRSKSGTYYVSDWYNCDSTVASYVNGKRVQD